MNEDDIPAHNAPRRFLVRYVAHMLHQNEIIVEDFMDEYQEEILRFTLSTFDVRYVLSFLNVFNNHILMSLMPPRLQRQQ